MCTYALKADGYIRCADTGLPGVHPTTDPVFFSFLPPLRFLLQKPGCPISPLFKLNLFPLLQLICHKNTASPPHLFVLLHERVQCKPQLFLPKHSQLLLQVLTDQVLDTSLGVGMCEAGVQARGSVTMWVRMEDSWAQPEIDKNRC